MEKPLSLIDRLKFAVIGAVFGVVLGAVLWVACAFAFPRHASSSDIIIFSVGYFAVVGLIMGEFVGDFVGAAVGGLLNILAAENYMRPEFTDDRTFRPQWIALSFVLWIVASLLIYFQG